MWIDNHVDAESIHIVIDGSFTEFENYQSNNHKTTHMSLAPSLTA